MRRRTNILNLTTRHVPWLLLSTLALVVALAPVALAGDKADDECLSSKLANQLLECTHCQSMKQLLGDEAIGAVTMEVHDLDHGVIIEVEATHASAVSLAHRLVDELWMAEDRMDSHLSAGCEARLQALRGISIDRALTPHGALVVLRSEDADKITWLREDARGTRSWVLTAASR